MQSTTKVLVVSGEPVSERRAGPAVRALAVAHELSSVAEVRLVSTGQTEQTSSQGIKVHSRSDVIALSKWAEVIIFQGYFLTEFPEIIESDKILVSDLYAPFHLEHLLELGEVANSAKLEEFTQTLASVNWQVRNSDFFICASEKQRDFWLGHLAAMGRINPQTLSRGADLRTLIDVVPFGIDPPMHAKSPGNLRKKIDAQPEDKVMIWGGGIYDWFDPLSLIQAMGILRDSRPQVKLFFLAIRHPNPNIGLSPIVQKSLDLAEQLGLLNKTVFFNEDWVPFEERGEYLSDADLGVSIHGEHIESRFSFRTRMLDYIWAGLPIVASEGDSFAELIKAEEIGAVAPVNSPIDIANAIENVLFTPGATELFKANLERLRGRYSWQRTLLPLVAFCSNPYKAADQGTNWGLALRKPLKPRPLWNAAKQTLRQDGFASLVNKVIQKIRG